MTKYLILSFLGTALFYSIYKLLLANEKWFRFNRFYLLAAIVMALVFPALDFNLGLEIKSESALISETQHLLHEEESANRTNSMIIEPQTSLLSDALISIYILGLTFFAARFAIQLIFMLKQVKPSSNKVEGFQLIKTNNESGVYSFFNYLFIPEKEVQKPYLDAILLHERIHKNQLHSIDNLLIEVLKVIFWFNPFMWQYAKAIKQNHEYLADEACSKRLRLSEYQNLLLTLSQSKAVSPIVSSFSYPKLKNRFIMMNKRLSVQNKMWKISLLAIFVLVFGALSSFSWTPKDKPMVVVIDPGHGGKDHGVKIVGLSEKDLVLQLSEELQKQAKEHNIKLIFTRNSDDFLELEERVAFPQTHKADFYLSLHINQAPKNKEGIEVYYSKNLVSKDTLPNYFVAEKFAQTFSNKMQEELQFLPAPFYVLKNATCPAILMECGFLSNENDRKKLLDPNYHSKLADAILNSIAELKS